MVIQMTNTKMLLLYFCLPCLVFELVNGSQYNCGDGLCVCSGIKASCRPIGQLNYIPKLPDNITTVDFSDNFVERIESADFFINITHISYLSMDRTSLTYIAPGAFDILQNLTSLSISFNSLDEFPENTFSQDTRSRLLHFDAVGNNFLCSCDLRWFSDWLISNSSVFNHLGIESYTCVNVYFFAKPLIFKIIELRDLNQQSCFMPDTFYSSIIIFSCIFLFFFIMVVCSNACLRCLEKHITVKQGALSPFRLLRTQLPTFVCTTNVAFKYDVFVAYAEEDKDFVFDHLRPRLEDELGLKLCLNQRDFHPGKNILENIEDSVSSSKKVLMVFSTHFAHRPWCQFELALCQRHAMDRGDVLLVVHVNNTPVSDLTPTMAAIVKTCTYIPWSQEGEGRVMFWNSLLLALGDVLTPNAPPSLQRRQQPRQRRGEMNHDEEQPEEIVVV